MTLSYRCQGDRSKPALVLLHGFMGSTEDWQRLTDYLQSHFYIILIDLPGHGNSALNDVSGFADFSYRLEQLLGGFDLESFSLMGYSLGGRLAMAFAQQTSQCVDVLLLEGAHPGLVVDAEREQRRISDQQWADRFNREPVADVLMDWYQQPVFSDLSQQQRQALICMRAGQQGNRLAQAMMSFSLSVQADYREALRKMDFPVHYFAGERDSKFLSIGRSLLDDHCLSGLHLIPFSGHNIHKEQPEALSNIILSIVRRAVHDKH
ncbi:2-succinyl-6-hydroxy-2,4-cyclohexadiene-1-carboxylate synthase [Endozoicomonas sp. (ex Bugula neritina AB1)]|nr:2-succinyl-6-hydroxy-2,4-cyclohexadiene-1-carboxylate synthase [Endozoicomonas sp. (ex Bugula neritina AB1)]